jgi:hypothetical protein
MKKTTDLEEFIRSKARDTTQGEPKVDWQGRKQDWLRNIANLYANIRKWLNPLEKDGVLSFLTATITLQEEYIGTYSVEVLTILIGKQRVEFHPKGTLIIGAEGRIDIRGQRGVRTIIFNQKDWNLVERSPKLKVLPFNQDSFHDVLSEVME